jgi:hypothetical protein
MARLTSRFLVDLLVRTTQSAGGFATILAMGDEQSGTILIQCRDRNGPGSVLERRFSLDGTPSWEEIRPTAANGGAVADDYFARRRKSDPDLWIVELDIADAPRLVADWAQLT